MPTPKRRLRRQYALEPKLLDTSPARALRIAPTFSPTNDATIHWGDCLDLLKTIPSESVGLVATSPPYNIGKPYEKRIRLEEYVAQQARVIRECVRVLHPSGSLCWQVGNYVDDGAIVPLDAVLYPVFAREKLRMRNRIVWHFEHGLHCTRRFSGRYEVVAWYTKSDEFQFDLDPVRVPQKYPGKRYFKGPRAGEFSCNPLGKNPGDVWAIPNVKNNHVEKTEHPCQFPVELIERLVLSMTVPGGLVVDPFAGAGSTLIAAVRHGRRAAGADVVGDYVRISRERLHAEAAGELRTRTMGKPVHQPSGHEKVAQNPFEPAVTRQAEFGT